MNTLIVLLLYNVFENIEQNILSDENIIANSNTNMTDYGSHTESLTRRNLIKKSEEQLIKRNFMVEFIKTEDYWVLMDLMCRQGAGSKGLTFFPGIPQCFD